MLRFNLFIVLSLMSFTAVSHASGSRTAEVTYESIASAPAITHSGAERSERYMNYVGSIEGRHVLARTQSVISRTADGRPGLPWDHTSVYTIADSELTIVNGWNIAGQLERGDFSVRPSDCPRVIISDAHRKQTLDANPRVKYACLKSRTPVGVYE